MLQARRMIKLALADALRKKGESLYWLHKKTRIRYATLHRLATKPVRKIDLEVLEKIAEALECEPCELLKRE
jgi:DNA-binding Xre family transcriptional regulator